mgnify:CR=1 FL=1
METSHTNAQYKRNDRYKLLYDIEWILSVLFFRTLDTTDTTDTTLWKPGLNQRHEISKKPEIQFIMSTLL